jgi:MFS family permease
MENVLENINPFGKYQKFSIVLVGLSSSLVAMLTYSTIFILAEPTLICIETKYGANYSFMRNASIHLNVETCNIWENIVGSRKNINFGHVENENATCSFDNSYYGLSIVNEWGLVCKKKYLATQTQSFFLAGTFTGIFLGPLSDKYGRKFLSIILLVILSITITVSEVLQLNALNLNVNTRYIIFSISQFILGSASNSIYSFLFILLIELSTKDFTTSITNSNLYMYVVGELLVMCLAYFLRNWHLVNWVIAVYSILVAFLIGIFLPESPRFLVQKKNYYKAFRIIKKMWLTNKRKGKRYKATNESPIENLLRRNEAEFFNLNSSIIQKFDRITSQKTKEIRSSKNELNNFEDSNALLYLFKSIPNFFKTVILSFILFSTTLCYFGKFYDFP